MPHLGEAAALLYEMSKTTTYTSNFDQYDAATGYVGDALPGTATSAALWRIKKLVFGADGDVTTTFADGNDLFDNIWDNRASLSYS
jgi:hypothetical protein